MSKFASYALTAIVAFGIGRCTNCCVPRLYEIDWTKDVPTTTVPVKKSRSTNKQVDISNLIKDHEKTHHEQYTVPKDDDVQQLLQDCGIDYSEPSLDYHKKIKRGEW